MHTAGLGQLGRAARHVLAWRAPSGGGSGSHHPATVHMYMHAHPARDPAARLAARNAHAPIAGDTAHTLTTHRDH
jgi:hypothetical protein